MAKYDLITSLSLQAAGFNQGLDNAKEKTKNFADGVKQSTGVVKGAFGNLAGMFTPITGQLGGLKDMATGGANAIKLMIPAVRGVGAAFIATGIGAIVVGLALAFSGLVSWMKRTDEGGDSLRKVFDVIKAVISTILDKLASLGSAIVKLFKGDFKGAAQDAKAAFTGWGDAISENVKKANELNEAQDRLEDINETYLLRESKIKNSIAELQRKAKDEENYGAEQRLRYAEQLKAKVNELYNLQNEKYQQELKVLAVENSQNKDNQELRQKYNDKLAEGNNLQAEHNNELRATQKIRQGILGDISKAQDELKKQQADDIKGLQPLKRKELKSGSSSGAGMVADLTARANKPLTEYQQIVQQLTLINNDFGNSFRSLSEVVADSVGELSESLAAGADSFKDYGRSVLNTIKNIVAGYLAESIAKVIASSIASLSKLGPAGMALIPVVAGMGAGLVKTAFNSLIPQFANGTYGFNGGLAIVGERGPELVNLPGGSKVFSNTRTKAMLGSQGASEVVFRIEGNTLVGVLNNHNRLINSIR